MDSKQFDDAIGVAPPSTVDVEAVILRQRRAAMVRRIGGPGVVAAAAVVAVTFGVALAVPGRGPDVAPGGGGPTGTAAPSSNEAAPVTKGPSPTGGYSPDTQCGPEPGSPPIPGDPDEIATRLGAVLDPAVRAQLPDAQLTTNPINEYNGRVYGPLEFFHVYEQGADLGNNSCLMHQDYFLARASVTDAAGVGSILAYLGRVATGAPGPACPTPAQHVPDQLFCEQRTGPAGERMTVATFELEGGTTKHRIDLVKPDGSMITLESANAVNDKAGGPAQRPTPHLTHDQLIDIALDPALTLFP